MLGAGDQVPVILSIELDGNDNASPVQIGPTWLNVGFTIGFTVTVNVPVFAHCPAVGVNV